MLLAVAPWQSAAERRRYGGAFAGWGTVAESHREAFAGRGAEVERLQRSGAVAEMLAAAWRIAIGKKLLPGRAIGKLLLARALQRSTIGKQPLPEMRATAGKERYCWKGEILLEMRATAGKEGRATARKVR